MQERADLMQRLHDAEKNCFQLRQVLHKTSQACKDMEAERVIFMY